MTREFYLKKADAISAAQDIINGTDGYMLDSTADNNGTWDYIDRDALSLDWGGECAAVRTYDEDGNETGLFAWWEENDAPVYAVVFDDQVVAGPFASREQAEEHCDDDEEVIEVLPTDEGYAEFQSYL